jgi:hypothetical protein
MLYIHINIVPILTKQELIRQVTFLLHHSCKANILYIFAYRELSAEKKSKQGPLLPALGPEFALQVLCSRTWKASGPAEMSSLPVQGEEHDR